MVVNVELDVPKMVQVQQWIASQELKCAAPALCFGLVARSPVSSPERELLDTSVEELSSPKKKKHFDEDHSVVPESRYDQYQRRLRITMKNEIDTMKSLLFPDCLGQKSVEPEQKPEAPHESVAESSENGPHSSLHPDLDQMEASSGAERSSLLQAPFCRTDTNDIKSSKSGRKARLPARYYGDDPEEGHTGHPEKLAKNETKSEKRKPLREHHNIADSANLQTLGTVKIELGAHFSSWSQFQVAFNEWREAGCHPMRIVSSESLKDVDSELAEDFKYKKIVYNCYHYGSAKNKENSCDAMLRVCYMKSEQSLKIVGLISNHRGHSQDREEYESLLQRIQAKAIKQSKKENSHGKRAHEKAGIEVGATFSSWSEFESAFTVWRDNGCHPLRIISSEALRDSDGVQDTVCKYKKVIYHCAHYGSLDKRGANCKVTAVASECEAMLRLNYDKKCNILRISGLVSDHQGHPQDQEHFNSVMNKIQALNRGRKRIHSATTSNGKCSVVREPSVPDSTSSNIGPFTSKPSIEESRFSSKSILPVVESSNKNMGAVDTSMAAAVLTQTLMSQKLIMTQLSSNPNLSTNPQNQLVFEMVKLQYLQLLVQLQQLTGKPAVTAIQQDKIIADQA